MKILLINPPRFNEIVADNPAFIEEERGHNPPLGILYVGTYLRNNSQHQVLALDAQVENLDYDDNFKQKIREVNPDVVGITALTFTLIDVVKTAKLIKEVAKELNKKIFIVLGGPHPTIYPQETAGLTDVDYAIVGEGEEPFLQLVEALANQTDLSGIKGLVYQKDGRVFQNEQDKFIEDLDILPIPDRTLLPIKKYNSILGGSHVVTTMFTSRGCPFQCAFCDRPHLGKRFRARSAQKVVDEMEQCIKLGIEEILVYDDTFTVNRERVLAICDEIKKRNLKIDWDIRARVDTVDEEVLRRLREAGCQRIHFGVEAGTDRILKVLNKGITIEQVKRAFAWCHKLGIETLAYFMIGAPSETEEEIEASIKLAKELRPNFVHTTILTPYPATALYHRALAEGVIKEDYWREFVRQPERGVKTRYWEENFTRQQLFDLLERFYHKFYGRPAYILSSLFKVKSFNDLKKKIKIGLKVLSISQ